MKCEIFFVRFVFSLASKSPTSPPSQPELLFTSRSIVAQTPRTSVPQDETQRPFPLFSFLSFPLLTPRSTSMTRRQSKLKRKLGTEEGQSSTAQTTAARECSSFFSRFEIQLDRIPRNSSRYSYCTNLRAQRSRWQRSRSRSHARYQSRRAHAQGNTFPRFISRQRLADSRARCQQSPSPSKSYLRCSLYLDSLRPSPESSQHLQNKFFPIGDADTASRSLRSRESIQSFMSPKLQQSLG